MSTVINTFAAITKALRIKQWSKNLLVFVPLAMAHKLATDDLWIQASLAFLAFSLCASSVYICNDISDLEADRAHEKKRHRPFASGALPVWFGIALTPVLLGVGMSLAFAVSRAFVGIMVVYLILTTLYTFWFKRLAILDVIVLASLYMIRMLAGSVATGIAVSGWLLGFSLFFFFNLALVKRYTEIQSRGDTDNPTIHGRGYLVHDGRVISQMGVASGYISVVVFALYISSERAASLYQDRAILWFICPCLFYWISRLWLQADRGQVDQDPIAYALQDVSSYVVGSFALVLLYLAA